MINLAVTSSLAPSLSSCEMRTKSRFLRRGRLAMTVGRYAFLLERGLQWRVRRDKLLIFLRVSSMDQSSNWLQCRYSSLQGREIYFKILCSTSGMNIYYLSPLSAVSPPSSVPNWVRLLKERSSQESLVIPIVRLYFCMLVRTLFNPERESMALLDSRMFRAFPP